MPCVGVGITSAFELSTIFWRFGKHPRHKKCDATSVSKKTRQRETEHQFLKQTPQQTSHFVPSRSSARTVNPKSQPRRAVLDDL